MAPGSGLFLLGSVNYHDSFDGQNREDSTGSYENCVAAAIELHHSRGDGNRADSQCRRGQMSTARAPQSEALQCKACHPTSQRVV